MKKLLLPALAVVACSTRAMAAEQNPNINWFVGGNASISDTLWSDEATDWVSPIELAENNFGIGAEAGVRIGDYDKIYNFGLTLNYDYLFDAGADIPSPYNSVFSEITTGFSAMSATFDNYIRIDHSNGTRSDLVFGLGYARATERVSVETTPYGQSNGFFNYSGDDTGGAFVLKFGINSELTDYIDWNVGLRALVPTDSDSDMDFATILSAGLRFKF